MTTAWAEQQLALLRPKYEGRFDIWFVRNPVTRQVSWHARPTGSPAATIHADSPEALISAIAEAERKA
jgi:hypothetical protein